jgi:twitching motility protein PilT
VRLFIRTGDIARFRVNVFVRMWTRRRVRNILTEMFRWGSLPPVVRQLCDKEKGLILVTGPTGSGKSTTLASMVDYLNNTFEGHIITIEDPIEFVHKTKKCLVNQRELGVHTLSFANALKSALREDPDIILVGEMRDLETIQLALTAAETGHLVFGTLHTQRENHRPHHRRLSSCPAVSNRTQLSEALKRSHATLLRKAGGRVAALEVMVATTAVRNLIREGKLHQIPASCRPARKTACRRWTWLWSSWPQEVS